MTLLKTVVNYLMVKAPIDVCARVNVVLLITLSTGGNVLVIRFTHSFRTRNGSVHRSTFRTKRIELHPVLVASFTFMLKMVPLLFTSKTNTRDHVTLNTTIIFNVTVGALLTAICVPGFCRLVRGLRRGFDGGGKGGSGRRKDVWE